MSIVYLVQANSYEVRAGDDAADARFVANWQQEQLAFDHRTIIADALALKPKPC